MFPVCAFRAAGAVGVLAPLRAAEAEQFQALLEKVLKGAESTLREGVE